MINPKLNDLPTKNAVGTGSRSAAAVANETSTPPAKPQAGLSVNDTIAAAANLSVGARGADTSGVRSGAGAGAGSSYLSPDSANRSPVPNVAPGPGGSGTTPLSDSAIGTANTGESSELTHDEIAAHAYRCWHERGCPEGSPEEDWHRAERELRERRTPKTAAARA
jgi:Protein of unknown function (DUF2934)